MLDVAVIGYGWWGRHIVARLAGHPVLRVVCVAEPDRGLHGDIATAGCVAVDDLDAALALPQVAGVILTTPHMLHEEQVRAAAAAGRHVFCEKPLGLTADSARRSVQAARDAGVVLGIGHERRFEPAMARLKAMIAAGDLGTLLHAEAAFSHDKLAGIAPGGWRTDATLSPGAGLTGMGIHLTDLLLWFFGPVATVQALTRDRVLGWPTGDMVVAQLGFAAGMTAHLNAILTTPHFMRLHVYGSDGWVEICNATHPDTPGGVTDWLHCRKGGQPVAERLPWTDAVVANLEAWAAAIAGQGAYPFTTAELIGNIALFEAIVASAASGQTVTLQTGASHDPACVPH
jgi:predicted dehydrogenase